jgi:hypothetical protein
LVRECDEWHSLACDSDSSNELAIKKV